MVLFSRPLTVAPFVVCPSSYVIFHVLLFFYFLFPLFSFHPIFVVCFFSCSCHSAFSLICICFVSCLSYVVSSLCLFFPFACKAPSMFQGPQPARCRAPARARPPDGRLTRTHSRSPMVPKSNPEPTHPHCQAHTHFDTQNKEKESTWPGNQRARPGTRPGTHPRHPKEKRKIPIQWFLFCDKLAFT